MKIANILRLSHEAIRLASINEPLKIQLWIQ